MRFHVHKPCVHHYVCLSSCGHIGCGRRAHLPALGGGHSKHHFHTTQGTETDESSTKKKRVKILKMLRSTSKITTNKAVEASDNADNDTRCNNIALRGHEVCIDIVSKAVHCYACDDYVLSDAPWLESLRVELSEIEIRRDAMDASSNQPSTDDGYEQKVFMDSDYEIIDHPDKDSKEPGNSIEQGDAKRPSLFEPGITGLQNLGNTCYMVGFNIPRLNFFDRLS